MQNGQIESRASYLEECKATYDAVYADIPDDIPFSNIWIAKQLSKIIPDNSVMHFGILNSLRSWNFFELPLSVNSYCNVGGFGIDGPLSTVIGGALAAPERLHFLVVGDLAFFYDINSLGNRHLPSNCVFYWSIMAEVQSLLTTTTRHIGLARMRTHIWRQRVTTDINPHC